MEVEVCSLYLFDARRERLVLRATLGLDRDSVGRVSLRATEGLVGLVIEGSAPVAIEDVMSHPRYKYFPETGEERYHTFLGFRCRKAGKYRLACWWCRRCAGENSARVRSVCCKLRRARSRRSFRIISCAKRSRPRKKSATSIGGG